MKEIGGYLELEHFDGRMLHEKAVPLNCGRNCLAYLIQSKKIKKLAVPFFMCDCVFDVCEKYGTELFYYHIKHDFMPDEIESDDNTWVYIMNYYGQLTGEQLLFLKEKYKNIIVDNAQAYFDAPIPNVDTLYTCRKFFGVSDGAFLYTDKILEAELQQDESYKRMEYLMGRYERTASEFYQVSVQNNEFFENAPIMRMSKVTENLLRAVNYEKVKTIRTANYNYLQKKLGDMNLLHLRSIEGAFAYPFLVENGEVLRKKMIENKIYVPVLWPNVIETLPEFTYEVYLAKNILPIPCDQRYDIADMEHIVRCIKNDIKRKDTI